MRLTPEQARTRLAENLHGVLATMHPKRGPDPQPVVYAVSDDGHVGVPIDRVKPKASSRLQREDNLEADPRGALLIEHWDTEDWSRLWWVRADLEHVQARRPRSSTSWRTGWRAPCRSTPTSRSIACWCAVSPP